MNLLSKAFNHDDIEIITLNKKYYLVLIIVFLLIISLLFIQKDNYYINSYSIRDEEVILLVEKNYVDRIKNIKEIIINDIKCGYSINKITPVDSSFLISINLNMKIKNTNYGIYKVKIGKEKLFEYIVRIIKKWNEKIKRSRIKYN